MNQVNTKVVRTGTSLIGENKVVRQTYMLLSATLLFSAATASLSVMLALPPATNLVAFAIAFGLMWFVLPRTANSAAGIGVVFAITGLLGLSLGPMLTQYLKLPNGPQLIATAVGGTGVIFLALSAYALSTRRDFSFMGGFLFVGIMVVLVAMLANIFLAIPAMSLAISAVIIMLMSGFILYDTGRMVNGGETNYVLATIGVYLSIFNIFVSLLQILGFARDD